MLLLLMAEILHQLRLAVYPIIYKGFDTIPGGARQISGASTVWFVIGPTKNSPTNILSWCFHGTFTIQVNDPDGNETLPSHF